MQEAEIAGIEECVDNLSIGTNYPSIYYPTPIIYEKETDFYNDSGIFDTSTLSLFIT